LEVPLRLEMVVEEEAEAGAAMAAAAGRRADRL